MLELKKLIFITVPLALAVVFLSTGFVEASATYPQANLKPPAFTSNVAVVIFLIVLVLILFIWEPLPIGIIAISIPVILIALKSWTRVSAEQALSGFSNNATVTVMAMFVISRGIQNSGAVEILGSKIESFSGNNKRKQIGSIASLTGFMASAINNTPVVAAFIPMVTNLARRTKISPSKLLIPLSYSAMLGGTITLFGTSTNILASEVSARLINHPFGVFEFTKLGLIAFLVGFLYLITVGYYLIPERISAAGKDLLEAYEMDQFLTELEIEKDSLLLGRSIGQVFKEIELDLDIVQITREDEQFMEPLSVKTIRAGDHLVIKGERKALSEFAAAKGIKLLTEIRVSQRKLEDSLQGQKVVELIVSDNSFVEGKTINQVHFLERYNATLLAIRHGEKIRHNELKNFTLRSGDVLLLLVTKSTLARLEKNKNFMIEREASEETAYQFADIATGLLIIGTVILLAALNLVSIAVATLGGVVAMVATELVDPKEIYEAINWEVFFLLAGLIPLGVAIEETGTAEFIAYQLLRVTDIFPPLIILSLFYLFTAVLTSVISNNASVVLMIPVAVGAATQLGANPFAFVLTVTFASSSAFLSPIGYQTNLMIYGPGGYNFKDFIIVGTPLLILLSIIIPIFITLFWGI
ncbi:SLC13 family permease [Halanaerobium sp.]|uniref:SLC13 family permease n=1 Tax=Halanaerobium sp. TaxID=1895664 RepID=UPI000DE6A5BE|nr:SLC13 family permease [Halanaerobium sp.]PUU87591.1 MAG: di-/tricarboxylate transporter [Halanaerobium sp.]PUU88332.1 MAG: di-/tricarboxylate transporter [Halanaerobium sp.]